MKVSKEVKKKARKMREMVKSTHWTRGAYKVTRNEKELYCLVGMANKLDRAPSYRSSGSSYVTSSLLRALGEAIVQEFPRSRFADQWKKHEKRERSPYGFPVYRPSIENWNDSSHRKREEIVKVLDAIIDA